MKNRSEKQQDLDKLKSQLAVVSTVILSTFQGITVEDLADPTKFVRLGHEPVAVDLLTVIDGVEFDAAWGRRVAGVIDVATGLTAFFISESDLVASKIAAGRTRDLADVEDIQEAARQTGRDEETRTERKPGKSGQQ